MAFHVLVADLDDEVLQRDALSVLVLDIGGVFDAALDGEVVELTVVARVGNLAAKAGVTSDSPFEALELYVVVARIGTGWSGFAADLVHGNRHGNQSDHGVFHFFGCCFSFFF